MSMHFQVNRCHRTNKDKGSFREIISETQNNSFQVSIFQFRKFTRNVQVTNQ